MARNTSSAEVTTHRAARRRRQWVVPATIGVVGLVGVASLVTLGVIRSGKTAPQGCTGQPVTVTIASSATQFPVLSGLARRWTDEAPSVDGRCVAATVTLKRSSEVAAALGPGWDPGRDGPRPDVWAPDSSLWVLVAASRPRHREHPAAGFAEHRVVTRRARGTPASGAGVGMAHAGPRLGGGARRIQPARHLGDPGAPGVGNAAAGYERPDAVDGRPGVHPGDSRP